MPDQIIPQDILQMTHSFLTTQIIPSMSWPELSEMVDYWVNRHEEPKGMVTDALPALVYSVLGGCVETALPMNGCWLFYLIAARVFDDIQDREGNGHPWNRFGLLQALPIGIGLMAAATVCLSYQKADEDSIRSVYRIFGEVSVGAAQAQRKEQIGVSNGDALEAYFAHIIGATARIFAAGAWAGGRLYGADEQTLKALSEYGYTMGMKYAILDDCYDLQASASSPSDLANGRYRLPVLYALAQPDSSERSRLQGLLSAAKGDEAAVIEAVNMLDNMGAIAWSLSLAQLYQQKSLAAIATLPDDIREGLAAYA